MDLLSPKKINEAKKAEEDAKIAKASKINDMLNGGVKSLNQIQTFEREEKERIAKELLDAETSADERKATLLAECESLEARKKEAEKPIDDKRKEFEAREEAVAQREDIVDKTMNELKAKDDAVNQRDFHLDEREKTIVSHETLVTEKMAEAELKNTEAENKLNKVNVRITALDQRESDLNERETFINSEFVRFKAEEDAKREVFDQEWEKIIAGREKLNSDRAAVDAAMKEFGVKT
jgi:chromosome segregation ATPase